VNPQAYPDKWASLKVKTEVYKIINSMQKDSREYWNERCAITVAWEETNGITKKQKKKTVKIPNFTEVLAVTVKKPRKSTPKKNNARIIAHAVRITLKPS
jgi:hypothetical protein